MDGIVSTVVGTLAAAVVIGCSTLAFSNPRAYSRAFLPLTTLIFFAVLVIGVWDMSISYAYKSLIAHTKTGELLLPLSDLSDFEIPFWLVGVSFFAEIYLIFLMFVPALLKGPD